MQSIKGITERFLKIHGTFSAPKGFARMLGALLNKPNSTASLSDFGAQEARFRYKVPHTVCREDNRMPLSAAIAVFDELSTVGIIALDKQGRWGASTNLSATMITDKPPKKGDELELNVMYDKFGKTLAFCHMELKDAQTGDLIAIGSHCKYMPVSWLFDNILSIPVIIGAIMNLLFVFDKNSYKVKRTWLGEKLVWSAPEGDNVELTEDLESILSSFGPLAYDESKKEYSFMPGQHHCNPFAFHGGAAAMVAEEAARLSQGGQGGLRKLDLTYLSAMQKSKSDAISVAVENVGGADGIVQGSLSQKGLPRVLFQGAF